MSRTVLNNVTKRLPSNRTMRRFACCMVLLGAAGPSRALTTGEVEALRNLAGKLKHEYSRIQAAANANIALELKASGCLEFAKRVLPQAGEHALLARLSNEIYASPLGNQLKNQGIASHEYVSHERKRVTGYRDLMSEGYAEAHYEALPDAVVIVFRGTKVLSLKDIATNLVQFSNILPERYRWADNLAARVQADNPGRRIVLTGHSLGGGLAMYAGARQMLDTVIFNPAGLSKGVLNDLALSKNEWDAVNGKIVAYIARSKPSIDPVSALSLAGDTVIAGRRYLVNLPDKLPLLQQHDITRLAGHLSQPEEPVISCTNDVGFQRI